MVSTLQERLGQIYKNAKEQLYDLATSLTPSSPWKKKETVKDESVMSSMSAPHVTSSSRESSSVISSSSFPLFSSSDPGLPNPMEEVREELEHIILQLKECQASASAKTPGDFLPLRRRLGEIDAFYQQGRFLIPGMDEQTIPEGQGLLASLLNDAHDLLQDNLEATDYYRVSPELRTYHDRLHNLISAAKFTIESKSMIPHSLHPSDLYHYRQKLSEIDEHYQQGRFTPEGGGGGGGKEEEEEESKSLVKLNETIPEGQAIIADLFQEAYDVIHQGLFATDYYKIVDEELMPLHDTLDDYIVSFTRILNSNGQDLSLSMSPRRKKGAGGGKAGGKDYMEEWPENKEKKEAAARKRRKRFITRHEHHLQSIHEHLVDYEGKTMGKKEKFDQEGYDVVMDLYNYASHLFQECQKQMS
jgi:hypothetical protein